ncbi:Spt20 family-domain-containing protein [Lentinula boryana]|uniref:Spt20 family-domain-containing protein n=1 Tax=Lentinula boryana TaxID=40481 RepID=A0ABQ8Q931_9AGAR|nr:Spt20 family-domain-containing protein [Lentinula boryana]
MDSYNRTRFVEGLLERYKAELPSFTIHLHPDAWTLNSGSRCRYDNQYVGFLDEVRAHRIPADFVEIFHESGVRYFEGCLIVDLVDYRPQKPTDPPLETPEKTREVLHPTSETLWADLCVINTNSGGTLTDLQALEIESRILLATSAPLCLDPNPHLSRIANNLSMRKRSKRKKLAKKRLLGSWLPTVHALPDSSVSWNYANEYEKNNEVRDLLLHNLNSRYSPVHRLRRPFLHLKLCQASFPPTNLLFILLLPYLQRRHNSFERILLQTLRLPDEEYHTLPTTG